MNEPLHATPAHALNWVRENAPEDVLRQDMVEDGWKAIIRCTPEGAVLFLRQALSDGKWYWALARRI